MPRRKLFLSESTSVGSSVLSPKRNGSLRRAIDVQSLVGSGIKSNTRSSGLVRRKSAARSIAAVAQARVARKGVVTSATRLVTAPSLLQPTFLSQRFGNNNLINSTKSGTLKKIKDAK